jgi:hypothetical protein
MRLVFAALSFTMLVAACGGSDEAGSDAAQFPDGAISVVANADVAIGPSRLIVAVAGSDGRRLGSPDDVIAFEVAPADQPALRQRADGVFVWIIEDAFGLYRAEFNFDRPGVWSVTVVPREGPPLEPSFFAVKEDTVAPGIGDLAPIVATPTAAEFAVEDITTDPEPELRFYELSLDAAARSGRTTVAVFSTPAFCRTATCGPLLDQTKQLAPDYPDVNFVHVEIYTGFNEPDFVPDGDHLAPPVTAEGWNLPSEPWVFVIDEAGVVTHRFEGVMDPAELRAALA